VPVDHPLTRDEAAQRAALLSDVAYAVALDLTGDGPTYRSRTTVAFRAEPGAATFLDIVAEAVRSVTLNGAAVSPADIAPGRITLRGLAADNTVEVLADCAYERTGVGLHRFVDPADGNVYLHTQFEPFDAHRVYACFDQPDLKATFTLTVTAPAAWEVISNSPVVERTPDGTAAATSRFAPTLPLSTYLTAVVAGPFASVEGRYEPVDGESVALALYCRPSLLQHLDPEEIFTITRQGFDYYTERFGIAYPFGGGGEDGRGPKKYDQLFVPEFNWGGMEHPGCVTYAEGYVFRSKVTDAARQSRAEVLLHELAHMWFGDLVTMRWWDDLWLNESFATYASYRALADATRFTDAWSGFANSIKAWALNQDQLPSTHPIAADIIDTEAVRTNFDGITYAKGASVLRQLVAWVGDEAFFDGLRSYFAQHAMGNASLTDFLTALEASSGRALKDWSQEWLETAGVATIRPEVSVAEDGTYTRVVVRQETTDAHPTLRSHRVAIGLYDRIAAAEQSTGAPTRLVRRQRVEVDVVGERTEVPALAGARQADLLLANDDDLTFAKLRLDERSAATAIADLSSLADPLARALTWGAAWDMTRDAELPTRQWVALAAAHAGRETDLTLLQSLLARTRSAVDLYGDPDNRSAARAALTEAAHAALDASEPGSDLQLAWLRHVVEVGDGTGHAGWVTALLDGAVEVTGLTMDTELRWHLVGALAAAGAADTERIEAELARDATDMGARRADAARAARPEPEAKAAAWASLTEDTSLSLTQLKSIAGGFWQPGQDALLRPYAERFTEAIKAVWAEGRVNEEALALTRGLYPLTLASEDIVAAAHALLAEGTLPPPGARVVSEAVDGTERALRARAADRGAAR
jgi:aminopeptidase N